MNLTEPLRRLAWLQPDRPALIGHEGSVLGYADLDGMLDLVGAAAERRGLGPGDIVGLDIAGSEQFRATVVALGLARRGIATAVAFAEGVRLHLTLAGQAPRPDVAAEPLAAFWDSLLDGRQDNPLGSIHADPMAIFRIFASSGTTGQPKTFALDHAQMERHAYVAWHMQQPLSRVHVPSIPNMTWGMRQVLRTLWAGGTLVFPSTEGFYEAVLAHGVTSVACGPSLLAAFLDAMPADAPPPPSLMYIEVGGAPLGRALRQRAEARLCSTIINDFGASEVGGIAAAPHALIEGIPGAVGLLNPGVEAQAVDETGQPVPPGEEGLLRFRGPGQARGYRQDPVATARHFRDGWFQTGDLGHVTPEGLLVVSGRAGDVLNIGGRKVAAGLVERVLEDWPGVREAAGFGVPGKDEIVELWAAVVADGPLDERALAAHLAARLGANAPRYLLQVTTLPRNAGGKLLRQDLPALAKRAPG